MFSTRKSAYWTALALSAVLAGCSGEPAATSDGPAVPEPSTKAAPPVTPAEKAEPKPDAPKPDAPKADTPATGETPKSAAAAAPVKLSDDEIASIKKLPADDQALALQQVVCPVSDEHLGAMDAPIKVSALGKTFFLCCKSCEKEVTKDPKAVIAKLTTK